MKKIIIICLLAFTIVNINATVHTLDNSGRTGAQFTTFQAAINAAVSGDTIYVFPSSIIYGSNAWWQNKTLHIIGTGHRTESESNKAPKFYSQTMLGEGSSIESIEIDGTLTILGNNNAGDPTCHIKNCKIGGIRTASNTFAANPKNVVIEGCLFTEPNSRFLIMGSSSSNWIIRNNIFDLTTGSIHGFINLTDGITLTNNLFLIERSPNDNFFEGCNSTTFTNNIFIFHAQLAQSSTLDFSAGCNGCVFSNNAIQTLDSAPIVLDPSNDQNNNILDANIVFESSQNGFVFDYSHNFKLAQSSDGNNAGLDGTDLGIFGQGFNFRMNGYSNSFPRMYFIEAEFQVIPFEVPVNITIGAKRAGL